MGYVLKKLNVVKLAESKAEKDSLLSKGFELVEEEGESSEKGVNSKSRTGGRAAKSGGGENED